MTAIKQKDANARVPEIVRNLINERGLKNSAVAERCGYKEQEFSAMLNGRKLIKVCDIAKLSAALGVEPNVFFPEVTKEALMQRSV